MKNSTNNKEVLGLETIKSLIYIIRGKRVMLDKDLAMLYGVQTKVLNQAVKRNIDRFPEDFMFKLAKTEADTFLRLQFVTSNYGRRKPVKAFTEQGIAMLSSVLNSFLLSSRTPSPFHRTG